MMPGTGTNFRKLIPTLDLATSVILLVFPMDFTLTIGSMFMLVINLKNFPLEPGVALPMTWTHNGKALSPKYGYVVGLEAGFSDRFLNYSEEAGVIELYRKLLTEQEGFVLKSDEFTTYTPSVLTNNSTNTSKASVDDLEFYAHKYKAEQYRFNMHL